MAAEAAAMGTAVAALLGVHQTTRHTLGECILSHARLDPYGGQNLHDGILHSSTDDAIFYLFTRMSVLCSAAFLTAQCHILME